MKKNFFVILFIFCLNLYFAQKISSKKWTDLFSYNNILAMKEDNGTIVAATENGIFYYNTSTGEISKLSKANGLHEVKISAFDYNPETKMGLVGYKNGTMDVISPDGITMIVDIPFATSYTGDKKINHISINGNLAVISVGYGVSIFKMDKKEFGDTAFFITNGIYEAANEAVIKDDIVYAVSKSGLKSHEMNVTFPVYSTWQNMVSGNFSQIDAETIIAFSDANTVKYGSGSSFSNLSRSFANIKDVSVTSQNIIVSDLNSVYVYNTSGNLMKTFNAGEEINTSMYYGNQVYAGTKLSGILDESKHSIKPDGPYTNVSYKISLLDGKILVSTGKREGRYNFAFPDSRNLGFYYYTGTEWIYPSYFKNNSSTIFNVLDAVENPSKSGEVFFTNYTQNVGQGVYKMNYKIDSKDFELGKFYSTGDVYAYNRPVGLAYDENNNLLATLGFHLSSSGLANGLMIYDATADQFSTRAIQVSYTAQKPIIYENMVWIPTPRSNTFGVYDFGGSLSNFSDDKAYTLTADSNLPSNATGSISISIDKSGDAWIGTDSGLRVLSSADSAIKDNPKLEPIIIEQNGVGEELFRDNNILQIETDSGNQKWISVEDGGVFYISSNGEKTFEHFTKSNSPLPNDSVTDIKVDNKTGKVYFVTLDGIVVYQGDVIDVSENFAEVKVYPNPVVYANFKGNVKITGLARKANIRIIDVAGNLVHQAVATGGYYEWNLNNQRGIRVASGIYYVLLTNEDGTDKASAKIAVVN